MKNALELPLEWKNWILENQRRGVDEATLIEILKQNSVPEQIAVAAVQAAELPAEPEETRSSATKAEEHLLRVYDALNAQHPLFRRVERRSQLSPEEFLRTYYCGNRPVVLLEMMEDWKALQLWTPEFLKSKYGHQTVEITANRNADPAYEINLPHHKTAVRFGDYVDMVLSGGPTNDYYMTANNHTLENTGMKSLLGDIVMFPEFLDSSNANGRVFFWFGPAGTVTPLHYDQVNIFMAQVYGRKLVKLIPSYQLPLVYNRIGVFSDVNFDQPDYGSYPLFRQVSVSEVTLNPGEVLFLPVGWWHHVRALDISITITLDNFRFPNDFDWS